ncbi:MULTISPECIES: phage scaffolding protein [unclassified Oceanobacillus]|uniref:phage scaffolding protein n=1 Tax=unclassified Oceanobacillus TaxID=2630292 RepID=UPI001BECC2E2|nr:MULTISPECIES: phage scaffolding protein [unclassified Oceanobacillus]MBT2601416.1 phage scaffolding protein [Oceanobacillus sp. ISL-74]MBT2653307.1 phage scaffolding protein [Oceanobacillus sp. ISL-73]
MDLKELLGEELYNQVAEKAGDNKIAIVSDGSYIPKEKFDTVNNEKNDYKQQLADRDTQLDDLKKKAKGNDELQEEIDRLKQENEDTKNQYEKDLQDKTFNYELEKALSAQQAKNPKAVKALLDKEAIKLDGDKLLGLEEQLTALKESDGYLFGEEQPAGLGGRTPVTQKKQSHVDKNPWKQENFNLTEQAKILKENPELAISLKSQAGVK